MRIVGWDSGSIKENIKRLRAKGAELRQNASEALKKLAMTPENQVLIARLGGIAPLVGLLSDQDTVVRRNAAGALGELAHNGGNQVLIARERGIGPLVRLLGDQDTVVRQQAAGALMHLAAGNDENQVLIAREGGIGPLVRLLGDQDTGVRRNAAGALWSVALNAENQVLIARAGGIGPLVRLLGDQDALVSWDAAGALGNLAINDENQVLIAGAGGIASLVRSLSDRMGMGPRNAAAALSNLAFNNNENQTLIARAGGVEPLVGLLRGVDRQYAAEALENLACSNAENQLLIARAGGIAPLVGLLHDAEQVRRAAAGALRHLAAGNDENKILIAREGGIVRLVALLRESTGKGVVDTRKCAVKALRELVNVSLWDEEGIARVLKSQKSMEANAEIRSDLEYILNHWQKRPDPAAMSQDLSMQGASLVAPSQTSSEKLSSSSQASNQSPELPAMGVSLIQASGVRLGRQLGRGAFGEVYEATYQFQKVAVKKYFGAQMSPSERAKIVAEIGLMAALKHKYLVALLGVIEESSGLLSLVMECGEKGALYDYLRAHSDIAWSWRLRVADELARGLAYLHEKNVVHRDIKSLNVVLDEDLHARWCDFGLAVLKQHATATNTRQDQMAGTARWMAPELFEDEPVVSRKGDIWSYGMVLFELATQTVPYQSLNERQVIGRLMKHKAEEVPEACKKRVPKFASLMEACWKVQEERPEATRLVEALAEMRAEYVEEVPGSLTSAEALASGFIGLSMNT